ncbi:MAG TPA: dTDP-4-dehydrorhamnose reductase [Actinomycetota bacterium]
MKIVLTGAGGGLGRAFAETCPGHHDLVPLSHRDLDIGDHDAVMRTVVPLEPDLIVNAAAFTDVDACESEPDRAARDNALGPQLLALAARRCGAVLLHVSTDYVFDGEKESPYDELDRPNPLSVYARTKLAGEEHVRSALPDHFVVRTGYLFGGVRDYATGAIRRLAVGEPAGGLADRTGTPTYVPHLAERLLPLVLTGRYGTYHLAGPEATTWFDVLTRAKGLGGLPGRVHPQRADDLGRPAPRPRHSGLTSAYLPHLGVPPVPSLDHAIRDLLASL